MKYPPQKTSSKFVVDAETEIIGCCAFKCATSLDEIVLHDNIRDLGDYGTFKGCTSLKTINIPPKVERLPPACFFGCGALEQVYVPDRERFQIEKESFKGCISLKGLHFCILKPESIFVGNDLLGEDLYNKCITDGVWVACSPEVFDEDLFDKCTLFIPSGTRWAYRHHPFFGKFKNIVTEKYSQSI